LNWIEKSTTKAIALVDKIDYMLQKRDIIKAVGNAIDIEDPEYTKYVITSFHSIARILISVNVTIYRTVTLPKYQTSSSHCIVMMTTSLRSKTI
jgi:hypothetical protein